jgi:hypothetical protein
MALSLGALTLPALAHGYPGGTPNFVTDVAPFCAGCHASVSEAQLAGVPAQRVQAELPANKHIAKIRSAGEGSPYADLTDQQRDELIAGIEAIDANSSVKLLSPKALKAGAVFEVTVEATGGGGPVVGLALVDSAQRWQARPAAAAGWRVLDKPRVVGPDGQDQTKFTDRRNPDLAPGISYVNVYGVTTDTQAGKYSSVSMTLRLRAPSEPGTYPLAAVFLYGTEKGSPHGAVETIRGKAPRGTYLANAGRVRFSDVLQITVAK